MKFTSFALLAVAAALPASACDLCAVYNVNAAEGARERGFFAGAAEQFTHFATLQENGDKIHDPVNQRLESSLTQIFAGYHRNDWLGAQLNVPVIHRSFRRAEGFAIDKGSESGLGDISVLLNATPLRFEKMHSTFAVSLLGGLKLPTGDSDRLREELLEVEIPGAPESGVHGHDLALGSGSVDGVVGSGVYARYDRVFFSGGFQYAIRTEGDFHYRYANDVTWNGGPGVLVLLSESRTLAVQLVASGEDKGKDEFRGNKAEDTAITSVFLGPQINFTWTDKLSAQAGVDIPVLLDNSAVQIVPDWRARAAVTWRF